MSLGDELGGKLFHHTDCSLSSRDEFQCSRAFENGLLNFHAILKPENALRGSPFFFFSFFISKSMDLVQYIYFEKVNFDEGKG